jgi:hypothetical protein
MLINLQDIIDAASSNNVSLCPMCSSRVAYDSIKVVISIVDKENPRKADKVNVIKGLRTRQLKKWV